MPKLAAYAVLSVIACATSVAQAGEDLDSCAAAFPGDTVAGAPHPEDTEAGTPSGDNVHLCYHSADTPFFALEYDPEVRQAVWVAYQLTDTFGEDQCGSLPRDRMGCYFKKDDVEECIADLEGGADGPGDPFHEDHFLKALPRPTLKISAFGGTGHDRGHMAPNNAFSWHLCGQYKTFTMANMQPQIAWLNRNAWADLEAQELFWAVTHGPIHIITGPIYEEFPADKFQIVQNGDVDVSQIVTPDTFLENSSGTLDIVDPTGFFKVLYRPAVGGEPARAIGFLLPNTTETGYDFWPFMARIDLVEEVSGVTIEIANSLKRGRGQRWWLSKRIPSNWSVRAECADGYTPQAWFPELTRTERVDLCASDVFDAPE